MYKYALTLAEDGRVLSATYPRYAAPDAELVDENNPEHEEIISAIHNGTLPEYRKENGQFVHDPLPKPEPVEPEPTADELLKILAGVSE